jgi:hypothetical protein
MPRLTEPSPLRELDGRRCQIKLPLWVLGPALIAVSVAGCGGAGIPSASPSPAAATYEEADAAVCSSFTALIVAVGNPDAGTPSILSKSLDDAVTASDATAADRAAASMTAELETGRQQAAVAGGWQPARPFKVAMDSLLVAFEAQVAAKRQAAAHVQGAIDPQTAFEHAGGVPAYAATIQAIETLPVPAGMSAQPCKAFSGTP